VKRGQNNERSKGQKENKIWIEIDTNNNSNKPAVLGTSHVKVMHSETCA
jgi:hypothetical protein